MEPFQRLVDRHRPRLHRHLRWDAVLLRCGEPAGARHHFTGGTSMSPQLRRALTVAACAAIASSLLHAQGRGGAEWTTSGYDAQRTASIKADPRISVQTMQKPAEFGPFKFLWKLKLEYDPKAATALTQPILLDRIISFRGFKSISFARTPGHTGPPRHVHP